MPELDLELKSLNGQSRNDLASGRKELSDLIEKGLSQLDERIIALRARIQHDRILMDEMACIQKERKQKKAQ